MQKLKLPELSQPILSKNSRCRSFYGWFPLKTLGKEAFSVNFLKKLKVLVLYQPISSTKLKLLEHKNSIFITQGLFTKKLKEFSSKLMRREKNSTIVKKKLKEFASKLKLPELLSTSGHCKIAQKKAWYTSWFSYYVTMTVIRPDFPP